MGAALLATDKRLTINWYDQRADLGIALSLKLKRMMRIQAEVVTLAHLDHPLSPMSTIHLRKHPRFFMSRNMSKAKPEEHIDHLQQPMRERDVLSMPLKFSMS